MAVENWNLDPNLNLTVEGIDVSEGSTPPGLNDVIRKIIAAVRAFYDKSYRKGESVHITAAGGAAPPSPNENDLWIEYTP